jgi:dephospho-CoA kinase
VVLRKIKELYLDAKGKECYSSFVVEVPLLYEIGAEKFYDVVITILADDHLARKRFEAAGFQTTEYDLRMKRQLAPEYKAAKSHYTIYNSGSLETLREEVVKLNRIIHKQ